MSLKISGYAFRLTILNTILLIIVLSYPSIKFFLTPYAVWLRLVIVILLIGCILLIKNTMFSLLALGNEKKELVQEWNFRSRELYYRNARVGPGLLTLDMI